MNRKVEIERGPPYLISYQHKGAEWSFQIWAESWDDAKLRLRAIAHNGAVIGSDCENIPVRTYGKEAVRLVSHD